MAILRLMMVALSVFWFHGIALALDEEIDVGSIKVVCSSEYFTWNEEVKTCEARSDLKSPIKDLPENKCRRADGLKFDKDAGCVLDDAHPPKAECRPNVSGIVVKDGKCIVDRSVPRSSLSDYVGDCVEVRAGMQELGLPADFSYFQVVAQKSGGEEKLLIIAPARERKWAPGCDVKRGTSTKSISVGQIESAAIDRKGWTYGVLALPFKYHRGLGTSSGVALGPYVGRRWGMPGTAYTFAVSAAIGTVRGEVRDADGNITDTPDLQAYSIAAGYMWDITKNPDTKAFKIGVFMGRDFVKKGDAVKFPADKKTWVAFQIGFDFTDN